MQRHAARPAADRLQDPSEDDLLVELVNKIKTTDVSFEEGRVGSFPAFSVDTRQSNLCPGQRYRLRATVFNAPFLTYFRNLLGLGDLQVFIS
jgi:hypothetical protein